MENFAPYHDGMRDLLLGPALLGALILGLANALVKPLMVFLTFPLTLVTFLAGGVGWLGQ